MENRDLYDDIRRGNEEQLRRIKFSINQPTEGSDLKKGIADDLARSQKDVAIIRKKGKDIKGKLAEQHSVLVGKQDSMFAELRKCAKIVGSAPLEKMSGYCVEGYERRLQNMPLKYGHNQIYTKAEDTSSPTPLVQQVENEEVHSNPKEAMYKYNNTAYDYVRNMIECIKTQTVIDAIEENKTYSLTVEVAAKLGF